MNRNQLNLFKEYMEIFKFFIATKNKYKNLNFDIFDLNKE